MNTKILGLLGISMLGISAAFAVTTSSVYFTASGNLSKYVSPIVDEDTSSSTTHDYSSTYAIGASYHVDDLTSDDDQNETAIKVYDGTNQDTGKACKVKYVTASRTATNLSGDSSHLNPPYVYKEISISELNFAKVNDYVVIPFYIYNVNEYSMYWNGILKNSVPNYSVDITLTGLKDATTTEDVTSTYLKCVATTSKDINFSGSLIKEGDTGVSTGSLEFKSQGSTLIYLGISLIKEVESNTIFSISFNLPEFSTSIK